MEALNELAIYPRSEQHNSETGCPRATPEPGTEKPELGGGPERQDCLVQQHLVSDVPLLQARRDSHYQCWPGVREPRSASRELSEGALEPSKLSPDMRGFHGAVKQAGLLLEEMAKGLQEGLCFVSLARKKGLRKKMKETFPKGRQPGMRKLQRRPS